MTPIQEGDLGAEPQWTGDVPLATPWSRLRLYWRLRKIGVSRREAFTTAKNVKGIRLG